MLKAALLSFSCFPRLFAPVHPNLPSNSYPCMAILKNYCIDFFFLLVIHFLNLAHRDQFVLFHFFFLKKNKVFTFVERCTINIISLFFVSSFVSFLPLKKKKTKHYSCTICFYLLPFLLFLVSISYAVIRQEAGYTLDGSAVRHKAT